MMFGPSMMGGFFGGGFGIAGMVIGYIFTALIIAGIIILIIWIVKRAGSSGIERTSNSGAVEILKQRYARGEITNEELNRIREDII